jgi:hypothetical protein
MEKRTPAHRRARRTRDRLTPGEVAVLCPDVMNGAITVPESWAIEKKPA